MNVTEYSDVVQKVFQTVLMLIGASLTTWVSYSKFLTNNRMRRLKLLRSLEDDKDDDSVQKLISNFKADEKFFLAAGIRTEAKRRDLLFQMYESISPKYDWKQIRLARPHFVYEQEKIHIKVTWIDEIYLRLFDLVGILLASLTIGAIIWVGYIEPETVNFVTLGFIFVLAVTTPLPFLASQSVRIAKILRRATQSSEMQKDTEDQIVESDKLTVATESVNNVSHIGPVK